jgi:hypothetical protein
MQPQPGLQRNSRTSFVWHIERTCNNDCRCVCHSNWRFSIPAFAKHFLGSLQMAYHGPPKFRARCSISSCKNQQSSLLAVYCFPKWFVDLTLHISIQMFSIGFPTVGLSFPRRMGWGEEDTIIRYALIGDSEGIKHLLSRNMARLDDVDSLHGRSALHVSKQPNSYLSPTNK